MKTRRDFVVWLPVAGAGLFHAGRAQAQAQAAVDPKDPQAVALGYVPDEAKADKTKYPKHTPDQKCASCQLYGGAAGSSSGPCPIFANKQVQAKGWCSAWAKKA